MFRVNFNLRVPRSVLEMGVEVLNPHAEEQSRGPFVTNQTGLSAAEWPFFFFFLHVAKQKRLTALIPGAPLRWYLFSITILWDGYWFFSVGEFHKLRYPTNSRKKTTRAVAAWSEAIKRLSEVKTLKCSISKNPLLCGWWLQKKKKMLICGTNGQAVIQSQK